MKWGRMASEDLGNDLPSNLDVLVLSPHLDDAALSCGGALHRLATEEAKTVGVVNVFTADAPPDSALSTSARQQHATWRQAGRFKGKVMAHRREEEKAACQRLGVKVYFLGFLDALYRQDELERPLYEPVDQVMKHRHSHDEVLLDALQARFLQLPTTAMWWLPMGIGHHVDHLLVREAAERIPGIRRLYFEDFPYACKPWVRFKGLWRRGWRGGFSWRRRTHLLRPKDLDAKIAAIRCHQSQLGGVFEDQSDMERQVRRFTKKGERLWSLSP